jgi:biotin transporter BioY
MGTSNLTLAGRLWPTSSLNWTRIILLALLGSAIVAVAAQVSVPMLPVPMTLQTLAALAVGAAYGARLGAITLALYALEGAAGLPVFANFQAGLFLPTGEILASGGYIIGFILAAGLVGQAVWRHAARRRYYLRPRSHLAGWLAHCHEGHGNHLSHYCCFHQRRVAIHIRRCHQGCPRGPCIPGGILASRPPLNPKTGRSERIRTSDPLLPKQVRYQTALHSDNLAQLIVTGNSPRKLLRGQGGSAIGGSVWGVAKR